MFQVDGSMPGQPFALPSRLTGLKGWRRYGFLTVLGALATLALPPVGFLPILLVSLTGLVWAWDGAKNLKSAFWSVWFWCLGFYAAGFYWIAYALLIDAATFGWMVPFATLGLGGVVALFPALGLAAGFKLRRTSVPARVLWLAVFWTVGEWLRTFVLTGFSWNPLGSVWDISLPVLQLGSVLGIHGVSFMTMAVFSLAAYALLYPDKRRTLAALAVGVPLLVGLWGEMRLLGAPSEFVPDVKLRMVQPNATSAEKWLPQNREPALRDLIALSRGPGYDSVTHLVWPESAVPFDLMGDENHRRMAAQAVPPHGLVLAGAIRLKPLPGGKWQFWNSLIAVDDQAQVQGFYDKAHLVPFGEYVPLRWLLPLPAVAAEMGDFSAGPGPRTLILPGLPPMGTAICYESIFPGQVVEAGLHHPHWLTVITNDGWFGISAGPYQHFAAGRMRAIEEGIPMIRAANTGISGSTDAYGRVLSRSILGQKTVVDSPLALPARQPTLYAGWGDFAMIVVMLTAALSAIIMQRYNRLIHIP